jgi:hypothetical protein
MMFKPQADILAEADWPLHKLLCKTMKCFLIPPGPNYYRAILFDERGPKPVFTWLKVTDTDTKVGGGKMQRFESEQWPGKRGLQMCPIQEFKFNDVLDRAHIPITGLGCAPPKEQTGGAFMFSEPPNKSLMRMDSEFRNGFGGLFIYYSDQQHLDTMSLRHIIDTLRISRGKTFREYRNVHLALGEVPAALCNCISEKHVFKRATVESGRAPEYVFSDNRIQSIPVAEKIGVPMIFYPIQPEAAWRDRYRGGLPCECNVQLTAISPLHWERPWGTVVVARKDKKPLHAAQYEASRDPDGEGF